MDTPTPQALTGDDGCRADLGRCDAYRPGHLLHVIHARLLQEDPRGWRAVTVCRIEGREILLVDVRGQVVLGWHHRLLTGVLATGEPALVHPRRHALRAGGVVVNVRLSGAPHPDPRAAGDAVVGPLVVDLSTGRALTVDG